jgi:hypothetical protein
MRRIGLANPGFIKARIALMVSLSALGGCVQLPDYPVDWAPLLTNQDCSPISGRYRNLGDKITSDNQPSYAHLAPLLFKKPNNRALMAVDEVEIEIFQDGILEITPWKGNTKFRTKRYAASENEFQCENGAIKLSHTESGTEGPFTGTAAVTTRFFKSKDGALIAKESAVTAAVAFYVIPGAGTFREWSRFESSNAQTDSSGPSPPTNP